jgi:HEAT repeat protein
MAAAAIGRIGPAASAAAAALGRRLEDEAFPVRFWAADALGRIGPGAAEAIPLLERTARDENPAVRSAAALALRLVRGSATPPREGSTRRVDPGA